MENYYFIEFEDEKEMFVVYFGTSENACYIGEFAREEEANEYVDFKNDSMDRSNPRISDDDKDVLDPEWDEQLEEDLVDRFSKEYGDFRD